MTRHAPALKPAPGHEPFVEVHASGVFWRAKPAA
jgi:hypothetical protein